MKNDFKKNFFNFFYISVDCNKVVGITSPAVIPNQAMTSSSFYKNHPAPSGRLNATVQPAQGQWGAWCAAQWDKSPYLQVRRLGSHCLM